MDIIISAVTQRTGSTLVQRIFNSRKKTLIWGEHGGALTHLYNVYHYAKKFAVYSETERNEYFDKDEDPNVWIANMSPEPKYVDKAIVAGTKAFLDTMYAQYSDTHDTIGFKEVRYGRDILPILKKCYPNIKFILVVRNPINVWKSIPNNWDVDLTQFIKQWNDNTSYYIEVSNEPGFYLVKYESMIKREKHTIEMLSELARVPESTINDVLKVKLNSTSHFIPKNVINRIYTECRDNIKLLNYEI